MPQPEADHVIASFEPLPGCEPALASALRGVAGAFAADGAMDADEVAARVERLAEEMVRAGFPDRTPLNQFFAGHLYAREILIPAGSFAIGNLQLYPHISVISRGEISMLDARGGMTRIRAPYTVASAPGVRKCGYAHEDTVWTTVHDVSALGLADPGSVPRETLEQFLVARWADEYRLRIGAASQEGLSCHQ